MGAGPFAPCRAAGIAEKDMLLTDGLTIRLARSDERLALEDLQRRASLVSDAYREALLAHPDAIELAAARIEAGEVWVAETSAGIAGFCVIVGLGPGEVELDGLFVEPALWRSGIGSALLRHAAATARASGAARLVVVAGSEAEAFYRSLGFVRTGEATTRFGPALAMCLRLV